MNGASALTSLLQPLCDLVALTEFASYKAPQWQFLLGSGDITVFALPGEVPGSLFGAVLRVGIGGPDAGYGMMVVSKEARGRGYARLLLEAAMSEVPYNEGRRVLAMCSPLGQPFYAKLGFKEVSMITGLKGSVASVEAASLTGAENSVSATVSPLPDAAACEAFVSLDREASGFERAACIRSLLLSGNSVSATAVDAETGKVVSRAVLRQDAPGAPLIVGPVIGQVHAVVPLLQALVAARPQSSTEGDAEVTLMVSDHPNLVSRLMVGLGFSQLFAYPGMTLDEKPVYQMSGGDGERGLDYLGLIHPTLG